MFTCLSSHELKSAVYFAIFDVYVLPSYPYLLKLHNYIQILRPKNLLIVALSQVLIYLFYLMPAKGLTPLELDGNLWLLFVLDTVLIAAGGYVINDIMDLDADVVNKPKKLFIGPGKISKTKAVVYYAILTLVGLIIAYYIASAIDKILLLSIYPFAVGMLYFYSSHLKRMPLVGNLVVSIFCAFVPAIILYAEWDMIEALRAIDPARYDMIVHTFVAYIVFAFLSTMVRELVKDMEDIEGDRSSGYRTLPIVFGKERANVIALFWALILLLSFALWFVGFEGRQIWIMSIAVASGLIMPTAYILRMIYKAKSREHYAAISKTLKILMIASLFIFLCIPFILKIT